jgi:2'-5' RNA ligase
MRTFLAIDIPEPIRGQIRQLMEALRPSAPRLRWSRPAGLHITLKFLGEISPGQAERVKQLLAGRPAAAPIQISLRQTGFFPNQRRPRVFWLGVEAGPELAALAGQIDLELATLGIARETRDFSPHLTLARIDAPTNLERLPEALLERGRIDVGSYVADEYFLYESKLAAGGSIYTKLCRFPLESRLHA